MKKSLLPILFILLILQGFSQTPITLIFQAKDSLTQNALALDSVNVQNITEGCDTTLYDAVSVLTIDALWPVGIGEPASPSAESFVVMQNVPNPFQGSTLVRIHLKNESVLNLAVYDNQGKNLSQYRNVFNKGWHLFGISTNSSQLLFLKVSDNNTAKTIKLLSTGAGDEGDRISYKGQTGQGSSMLKSFPAETGFIFYLGNQLRYTAYVEGYHESILYDNPVSNETYSFPMLPVSTPTIPSVSTSSLINITQTTATSGGNVSSDGGAAVTSRGVCWANVPGSTTAGSHTNDGSGTGIFVSNLTGLTPNMLYYIRAYATNSLGTAYGNELTFTTLQNFSLPVVTTTAVTNVAQTTATSGGNVTSDGGTTVTIRGVCWSTSPTPTVAGNHTIDGSGTGSFISNLTGLTPATPYYIRAYATNSVGTAYGSELQLTTLSVIMPTLTTTSASNITQTTAISGGNVTSDGGATVTARGVCWSTSPTPTTAGSHTTDGSGTGAFTSNLTGLTPNTPYYIRAYATNSLGTAYGSELTFTTLSIITPTVITTPVTNITQTTATSGGNVTSDGGATVTARGVCWSTSSTPTIAGSHTTDGSGSGTFVSNLTGLTLNTPYYIRAYATNSLGTAYGNELTFTTSGLWSCGQSFTINHVTGAVAPVDKTVIYGTVTNIPGETSKCWITSNLGSDHQATAVNDATEASAGWYWQFNRKQGFKHDGTTRTPNTPWITYINENSDWIPANDPCILELGSGWRIQTNTEWTNVDASGNWTNWNGPWNSALKMHAAGMLLGSGSLSYRGSYGQYWSSTQDGAISGWILALFSSNCYSIDADKTAGYSVRCVRD